MEYNNKEEYKCFNGIGSSGQSGQSNRATLDRTTPYVTSSSFP